MTRCTEHHPTLGYLCIEGDPFHGRHEDAYGNHWYRPVGPPPPVTHLPVVGWTETSIEHPTGECVWCDAERWREATTLP